VSCSFDLGHYRELLEAARDGGYSFVRFDKEPAPRDLFLRHDVDLSLGAAVQIAELEAELDVMRSELVSWKAAASAKRAESA